MPRILPWDQNATKSRALASKSTGALKRKRMERAAAGSDSDVNLKTSMHGKNNRGLSSSPPPSPPSESLMEDGFDQDDRYRMVEDELLAVAQKFTVHLHAAEYKKQQRVVHSRNAQTINTISRPAVGKMPDHTRRRIEGLERSEKQKKLIETLDEVKHSVSEESDSDDRLPYAGTMLHGLMDRSRRAATSLANIAGATTSTRSAAGFKRPAAHSKDPLYDSPQRPSAFKVQPAATSVTGSTASSDDEDDLDAPIPAPKLVKKELSSPIAVKTSFYSNHEIRTVEASRDPKATTALEINGQTNTFTKINEPLPASRVTRLPIESSPKLGGDRPRTSRFERAQQLKAKEKRETESKKKALEVIPTFL